MMQTNVKPASPMLAPEQRPSKPPSPLRPKNAPKNTHFAPAKATTVSVKAQPAPAKATTVSRQPAQLALQGQPRCPWAAAGPGQAPRRRASTHQRQGAAGVEGAGGSGGHGWASRSTTPAFRLACGGISRAAGPTAPGTPEVPQATPSMTRAAAHRHSKRPGPPAPGTPAAPTTQRNEAATGFPATASSRSRSAVHNSATSNQAVMST